MPLKKYLDRAKKEKKRAQSKDTAKKVGIGLGIGAALGSTLGILLAPKAGKETRANIAHTAQKTIDNVKENVVEVSGKIQNIVEEGKGRIAKIKNSTPELVDNEENKTILDLESAPETDLEQDKYQDEDEDQDLKA